jgi:hypothetical protein
LEYLINGKISIYYFRDEKGDHFYLEKIGENLVEIPYEEGITHRENSSYFFQSKKHIGILAYYMNDAPHLQQRISEMKNLNPAV